MLPARPPALAPGRAGAAGGSNRAPSPASKKKKRTLNLDLASETSPSAAKLQQQDEGQLARRHHAMHRRSVLEDLLAPPQHAVAVQLDKESFEYRLRRFFSYYEPSQLSRVSDWIRNWAGREEELVRELIWFHGPEPPKNVPLEAMEGSEHRVHSSRTQLLAKARGLLINFLTFYAPERLYHTDAILAAWDGSEETLCDRLQRQANVRDTILNYYNSRAIGGRDDRDGGNAMEGVLVAQEWLGLEGELLKRLPRAPSSASSVSFVLSADRPTQKTRRARSARHQVRQFFKVYKPEHLSEVDAIMEAFEGREDWLLVTLRRQYLGEMDPATVLDHSFLKPEIKAAFRTLVAHWNPSAAEELEDLFWQFEGSEEEFILHMCALGRQGWRQQEQVAAAHADDNGSPIAAAESGDPIKTNEIRAGGADSPEGKRGGSFIDVDEVKGKWPALVTTTSGDTVTPIGDAVNKKAVRAPPLAAINAMIMRERDGRASPTKVVREGVVNQTTPQKGNTDRAVSKAPLPVEPYPPPTRSFEFPTSTTAIPAIAPIERKIDESETGFKSDHEGSERPSKPAIEHTPEEKATPRPKADGIHKKVTPLHLCNEVSRGDGDDGHFAVEKLDPVKEEERERKRQYAEYLRAFEPSSASWKKGREGSEKLHDRQHDSAHESDVRTLQQHSYEQQYAAYLRYLAEVEKQELHAKASTCSPQQMNDRFRNSVSALRDAQVHFYSPVKVMTSGRDDRKPDDTLHLVETPRRRVVSTDSDYMGVADSSFFKKQSLTVPNPFDVFGRASQVAAHMNRRIEPVSSRRVEDKKTDLLMSLARSNAGSKVERTGDNSELSAALASVGASALFPLCIREELDTKLFAELSEEDLRGLDVTDPHLLTAPKRLRARMGTL